MSYINYFTKKPVYYHTVIVVTPELIFDSAVV